MIRRGVALMSVLVVLTLAALAGTTTMVVADASVASARTTLHRAQARALAWSGVQAAMQEIAEQREALLMGGRPTLTTEWTLYESPEGRGLIRLVELREGEPAVSECAKADINVAAEESLAKLEAVGKELAAKVVEARTLRPFSSPESLMRVDRMTADLLYGVSVETDPATRSRSDEATTGLLDLMTTFSFDPNIQSGLGQGGEDHHGKLRININSEWTEDMGAAVAERFGPPAADVLKQFMQSGETFKRDADVVKKLIALKVPAQEWGPILDALTTSEEPYLLGRVDLMHAPEAVLACVPGIDTAAAAAIVAARERLDEIARLSTTWIVEQEIITPDQFVQAADWLTTRSTVWRIRVEAGIAPPDSDEGDGAQLTNRVVLDAVIDVSSERPRVAYLRDVTALPAALAMRARLPEPEAIEMQPEPDPTPPDDGPRGSHRPPAPSPVSGPIEPPNTPEAPAPDPGAPPEAQLPPPKPPGKPAGSGPDRRLGRWTTGPDTRGGRP